MYICHATLSRFLMRSLNLVLPHPQPWFFQGIFILFSVTECNVPQHRFLFYWWSLNLLDLWFSLHHFGKFSTIIQIFLLPSPLFYSNYTYATAFVIIPVLGYSIFYLSLLFLFHFGFQFGRFLLTFLQAHGFFSRL